MLVELAIGDAYGAAFEFVDRRFTCEHQLAGFESHPRHRINPGRYTDDTQMSIAVAELIVSGAPFTRENLADCFVQAFRRDPRTGYAKGFYHFLLGVKDGADFLARITPTSDKNGGAMRAAPVGVFPSISEVVDKSALQASLTHDTEEGRTAAIAVSLMAHFFLYELGTREELPEFLATHAPGPPWQERWFGSVDVKGYSAVRAALRIVLEQDRLTAMLEQAVRFGGDTDTVASIALGVASCCRDVQNDLPKRLVMGLEAGTYGREFLRELDRQLLHRSGGSPASTTKSTRVAARPSNRKVQEQGTAQLDLFGTVQCDKPATAKLDEPPTARRNDNKSVQLDLWGMTTPQRDLPSTVQRDKSATVQRDVPRSVSRIAKLRSDILKAKQTYYYGGDPLFSDREYDALEDELRALAPDDPVLALVGAPVPPDAMLKKARHRIPMGSQSKVNSVAELRTWHQKSGGAVLHASLKGDGASAAAYFDDGELKQCISRGDGTVGEDVTANALKFKGLPAYVAEGGKGFAGAVRIEVILTVEDWGLVDPTRAKNPRNVGTGIMGRKNGQQAELLTAFAFDLDEVGREFTSEKEKTDRLLELGFNVIEHKLCATTDEAIAFFEDVVTRRDDLPIWIDGVVLKVDDIAKQQEMGVTSGRPKGQLAWKFDSAGAETTLLGVNVTGGHTGALIPNAQLAPVEIGGTTVKSASLANYGEIERLGVAVGDRVWVIKANDIIPKVVRVTQKGAQRQAIEAPSTCPFCGGSVGRRKNTSGDESVVIACQNEDCPKKSIGKIKRWIKSVDIQGIGDSVLMALVEQLELEDAADLYRLREKKDALVDLIINQEKDIRLGEKRATSILEAIEARRALPLQDFLGALGIDRLGKRRVELMMRAVPGELDTLDQWRAGKLRDGAFAEKAGVPNTGVAMQDGVDGMSALIERMLAALVEIRESGPADETEDCDVGGRRTVCITGKLTSGKKKTDYAVPLQAAGYRLVDKVDADLDYLVLADPGSNSSKAQKARKLNVKLISEEELQRMLTATEE